MILIIDNFDSFTFNLVDYFHQLGADTLVVRNDQNIEALKVNEYQGIVLSPGPGVPENAGNLIRIIDLYHKKLPILGICLGQQAICNYFGGEIGRAIRPMHGKISEICHYSDVLFQNIPLSFNVIRYHSLVCSRLPSCIKIIAETKEKEVMAIRHNYLPIWGVQFHPEAALTQFGLKILQNWMQVNNLSV